MGTIGPGRICCRLCFACHQGISGHFCGRTPCLVWLRRRTLDEAPSGQSTEMHRGHAGLSAGSERMNLIDHGRNLRASLPSVSAIGDPLYQICDLLSYVGVPTLVTKRWGLPESDGGRG